MVAMVLFSTSALSEETKSVTVKEFVDNIKGVPTKVSTWAQNEWTDIKEYQKKGWEEGKAQNARNVEKIKSFFANLNKGN